MLLRRGVRAVVAVQHRAVSSDADSAMVQVPEEDEFGRPTDVPMAVPPAALVQEQEEYWQQRFSRTRWNQVIDNTGRVQEESKGTPWNPNPEVTEANPLTLETTRGRVQFPGCTTEHLEVPVFDMHKNQVGTRVLDNYIFGRVPEVSSLHTLYNYELHRRTGFGGHQKYSRQVAPGVAGQWKPHMRREGGVNQGNMKNFTNISGAVNGSIPELRDMRYDLPAYKQSEVLRMALTMKLNKERLIILEDLKFPAPSVDLVRDWAHSWGFDRDRLMAYIIDGGSHWAPTQEMHRNSYWTNIFCYGIQVQEPRSLNGYDALRYHYLVLTEGAVKQLEHFFNIEKSALLPPHIANKMSHPLADLGEKEWDWATVEEEAAYEVAKEEENMLEGFRDLDDPWLNGKRWSENERRIKEHRRFVSEHLPRAGDRINEDIQRYWHGRKVHIEEQDPAFLQVEEYSSPWNVHRYSTAS